MCLSNLSEKSSEIKGCRRSKVLEGALVGYKVVGSDFIPNRGRVSKKRSKFYLEPLHFTGKKIKSGWNRNKSHQNTIFVPAMFDNKEFEYTNGFHIYVSVTVARISAKGGGYLIPVHFYPKDVVAEGDQGNTIIKGKQRKESVVVVSKYFLSEDVYKKTLAMSKKDTDFNSY